MTTTHRHRLPLSAIRTRAAGHQEQLHGYSSSQRLHSSPFRPQSAAVGDVPDRRVRRTGRLSPSIPRHTSGRGRQGRRRDGQGAGTIVLPQMREVPLPRRSASAATHQLGVTELPWYAISNLGCPVPQAWPNCCSAPPGRWSSRGRADQPAHGPGERKLIPRHGAGRRTFNDSITNQRSYITWSNSRWIELEHRWGARRRHGQHHHGMLCK